MDLSTRRVLVLSTYSGRVTTRRHSRTTRHRNRPVQCPREGTKKSSSRGSLTARWCTHPQGFEILETCSPAMFGSLAGLQLRETLAVACPNFRFGAPFIFGLLGAIQVVLRMIYMVIESRKSRYGGSHGI